MLMKRHNYFILFFLISLLFSCDSSDKNIWDTEILTPQESVKITDLSEAYFDKNISDDAFKKQYPWLQGSVSDSLFSARRTDPKALKVYDDIKTTIPKASLQQEIASIFRRIKMHFPQYESPKVFTYSSDAHMYLDPIIYDPDEKALFIDLSCFLGEDYPLYHGIENYIRKQMNPQNLIPKIAESIARTMVPFHRNEQKLLELMIYEGKIKVAQEAFCPEIPAHLRMNLTQQQYSWTKENEPHIWNYFIEKDLLFSEDQKLVERFIAMAPFSKFYSEIDKESSPQVGVFIGKSICDKYLAQNEKNLASFLSQETQKIYNQSGYNP